MYSHPNLNNITGASTGQYIEGHITTNKGSLKRDYTLINAFPSTGAARKGKREAPEKLSHFIYAPVHGNPLLESISLLFCFYCPTT